MSTHSDYARETHQSGVWRRWNIRDGSRWFAKILMPSIHLRPVTRVRHKEERWVAFSQILYPPWILMYANVAFIAILCWRSHIARGQGLCNGRLSVSPSVCPVDSSRLTARICRRHRSERPALVMWPEEEDRRRLVLQPFLVILRSWPIWNESVPKIILNITINLFLSCNQHFGNFKP